MSKVSNINIIICSKWLNTNNIFQSPYPHSDTHIPWSRTQVLPIVNIIKIIVSNKNYEDVLHNYRDKKNPLKINIIN